MRELPGGRPSEEVLANEASYRAKQDEYIRQTPEVIRNSDALMARRSPGDPCVRRMQRGEIAEFVLRNGDTVQIALGADRTRVEVRVKGPSLPASVLEPISESVVLVGSRG